MCEGSWLAGQRIVEVIAKLPAHALVVGDDARELAFGADTFEEHHELKPKEDHRVDARPTPLGGAIGHPVADEAQIKRRSEEVAEACSSCRHLRRLCRTRYHLRYITIYSDVDLCAGSI